MKKFSELNIQQESGKMFDAPTISISEVVNCELVVLDFESDVKTKHGNGRMIILVEHAGVKKKIFTNSTMIKGAMSAINEEDFPFQATIKAIKTAKGSAYKFS